MQGDLADLMLTFPALRPEDFRPWINEDDAAKAGASPDDFAKSQAEMWSKGLADWGQDGARIQRLRHSLDKLQIGRFQMRKLGLCHSAFLE